ncbi:MAG TPA: UMP kinase [Elusimicrobiales bacterium]|nr:UMP kinase [Elusimicrobiales bacterium]
MPRRVLLKLSGEALCRAGAGGIDPAPLRAIASEIAGVPSRQLQLAIVIGGGNIWRGASALGGSIERVTSDNIGMLATVINALALQSALEKEGVPTRVQTAITMKELAEPFIRRRAMRHLEKGRVVIFAGGTGSPYFTTDTAAALRASEIGADLILKATQVDWVYTDDPRKNPDAKPIKNISYMEALRQGLRFMDASALSLCMENKIPVMLFNLHKKGNIKKAAQGGKVGTLITAG